MADQFDDMNAGGDPGQQVPDPSQFATAPQPPAGMPSAPGPSEGGFGGAPAAPAATDTYPGEPMVAEDPADSARGDKAGFFSTTAGRAVIIGGAIAALLVLAGLAGAAFLIFMSMSSAPTTAPQTTGTGQPAGTPGQSAGTTTTPDAAASVPVITNADVYVLRDPFTPLIAVDSASSSSTGTETGGSSSSTTSTSGGGSNEANGSTTATNTLTLQAITTVDGVKVAKFTLNGNEYAVSAGEQIGDTPWKVVVVGSDYAVVLYGDEKITLTVGQGVTK